MPTKQSPQQKKIVGRVMHEFQQGDLESGSGDKVRNPRQAIAIALHEAGSSNQESPAGNRRALARTRRIERAAGETRSSLYERAKQAGIAGRSKMTKPQLERALRG